MPYFTPPGGDITAAYARGLLGMNYYVDNVRTGLHGLGALRFNRAVARGHYRLPFYEAPLVDRGLGQLQVEPSFLIGGMALLGLGLYLLGGRHAPARKQRRISRLERKLREARA